jgi:hypothetical protein
LLIIGIEHPEIVHPLKFGIVPILLYFFDYITIVVIITLEAVVYPFVFLEYLNAL